MEVYLVGGAVRDELLGLTPAERDWVVVGATPELMERRGFRPVGRDFPVFLHPETQEEYALARLERKTGSGYRGFVTEFAPTVTLEQDLQRRDLTINAIARADDGTLIDPTGGQADLRARVLRHVAPAFIEDPVRLLRVARFAARFAELGFSIAPETMALMRRMVTAGEIGALVPERVWRELARALDSSQPRRFFDVLADSGALPVVMPELAALWSTPAAGDMALAALQAAAVVGAAAPVRWAALLAGISGDAVSALCERLRAPREYRDLAQCAARLQLLLHRDEAAAAYTLADAAAVVALLEAADGWRRPERFAAWLQVLEARAGAAGMARDATLALRTRLALALQTTGGVRLSEAELAQLPGPAIAVQLRLRRIAALSQDSAP